ncbi:hypothetical protein B0H12DRAFT_1244283 [Mycena haematopus]|nr:hypothetical protein B0H12DRAFT_1244283 [Mycena haematopus]
MSSTTIDRVLRRRHYAAPPLPHAFWTTQDVVLYLFRFLNLLELVHFSHLSHRYRDHVKNYIKGRIMRYTASFFPPFPPRLNVCPDHFSILQRFFLGLHVTNSWIVGSVALAVASTLSDAPSPTNMNIITSNRQCGMLVNFFTREAGFQIISNVNPWSGGAYATAASGRIVWLQHGLVEGKLVSITSSSDATLGPLFFAAPNTDQWIAIAAHELITPVLDNVAAQRHLLGWRPTSRMHPSVHPPEPHRTYRSVSRFPDMTTLEESTVSWGKPCGYSCPAIWRAAKGLKGFAHIKWGGMDGEDTDTDAALTNIGRTRLTFTLGRSCINPFLVYHIRDYADIILTLVMIVKYNESVQARVLADISSRTPVNEHLVTALLWGAGSERHSFVPVPRRRPSTVPSEPDDLDISYWIPCGLGPASGMVDLSTTRLKITHWPFDTMDPLPYSFTVCVAPQTKVDQHHTREDIHPLNNHFNYETLGSGTPFKGNVLVIKHGIDAGLEDMTLADLNVATSIVRRLIEERLVGFPRL